MPTLKVHSLYQIHMVHSQKRIMKPFAFAKSQNFRVFTKEYTAECSDIREASGFVITPEPLGFVIIK